MNTPTCKHCGKPANDNTHYFRTHDDHPYCCVSDRKGEARIIPGVPYARELEQVKS